jgi:hypothetical protein
MEDTVFTYPIPRAAVSILDHPLALPPITLEAISMPAWLSLLQDTTAVADAAASSWSLQGTPRRSDVTFGPTTFEPALVVLRATATLAVRSANISVQVHVKHANKAPAFDAAAAALALPAVSSVTAGSTTVLSVRQGRDFADPDAAWGDSVTLTATANTSWVSVARSSWKPVGSNAWLDDWQITAAPATSDAGSVAQVTVVLTDAVGLSNFRVVYVRAEGVPVAPTPATLPHSLVFTFADNVERQRLNASQGAVFAYTLSDTAFMVNGSASAPSAFRTALTAEIPAPRTAPQQPCAWLTVREASSTTPPVFSGTPGAMDVGTSCRITVVAENVEGDAATGSFVVAVANANGEFSQQPVQSMMCLSSTAFFRCYFVLPSMLLPTGCTPTVV